mgnify:CR=1 FL=1
MPTITLPDGNTLDFSKKITGLEVAEKISKSLAKEAMVISVNGEDLVYSLFATPLIVFGALSGLWPLASGLWPLAKGGWYKGLARTIGAGASNLFIIQNMRFE